MLAGDGAFDQAGDRGGDVGELEEGRGVGWGSLDEVLGGAVGGEDLGDVAVGKRY